MSRKPRIIRPTRNNPGSSGGGSVFRLTIEDAASETVTVVHGLGTQDIAVTVNDLVTGGVAHPSLERLDDDTLAVAFDGTPESGRYRLLIQSVGA